MKKGLLTLIAHTMAQPKRQTAPAAAVGPAVDLSQITDEQGIAYLTKYMRAALPQKPIPDDVAVDIWHGMDDHGRETVIRRYQSVFDEAGNIRPVPTATAADKAIVAKMNKLQGFGANPLGVSDPTVQLLVAKGLTPEEREAIEHDYSMLQVVGTLKKHIVRHVLRRKAPDVPAVKDGGSDDDFIPGLDGDDEI